MTTKRGCIIAVNANNEWIKIFLVMSLSSDFIIKASAMKIDGWYASALKLSLIIVQLRL